MKKLIFILLGFVYFNISMSAENDERIKQTKAYACEMGGMSVIFLSIGIPILVTDLDIFPTGEFFVSFGGVFFLCSCAGLYCWAKLKCKRRNRQIVVAQPPVPPAPLEEIQTQETQEDPPGGPSLA